ncbi:TetR/AcrR family transcriptional regulator [Kitasatospora aureofaciens]|uniref:TetR/AcrR family transcriptional regulator n=1 Tax=Kitasatospora aureofaciens TaxID=1894 RepID=UPI0037CA8F4F
MTPAGTTAAQTASRRADARRNRAHILQVAQGLLATDGLRVSFDDLAQHAGVGVGTVYRNFPTKNDLFRAVVADGIRRVTAEARRLSRSGDPAQALLGFFHRLTEQATLNKALCEGFEALDGDPGLASDPEAERDFLAALGELLARAQSTGAIRADLGAADLRALVVGAATAERARADGTRPGRMTALLGSVLRADAAGGAPGAVTKPLAVVPDRNESCDRFLFSNETFRYDFPDRTPDDGTPDGAPGPDPLDAVRCELCGRPVPTARTGRPARFCGAACRQKAHRRRHGTGTARPAGKNGVSAP